MKYSTFAKIRAGFKCTIALLVVASVIVSVFAVKRVLALKAENTELKSQNELIAKVQEPQKPDTEFKKAVNRVKETVAPEVVAFDAAMFKESLSDIAELTTVRYDYTVVGEISGANKIGNTNLNWIGTSKELVASIDGIIKIGVDVDSIMVTCDEDTKTIKVIIPAASVKSNELLTETYQVYTEETGWFTEFESEEFNSMMEKMKTQGSNKVLKTNALTEARTRAGEIVKSLLEADPNVKENYTIVIA